MEVEVLEYWQLLYWLVVLLT